MKWDHRATNDDDNTVYASHSDERSIKSARAASAYISSVRQHGGVETQQQTQHKRHFWNLVDGSLEGNGDPRTVDSPPDSASSENWDCSSVLESCVQLLHSLYFAFYSTVQ